MKVKISLLVSILLPTLMMSQTYANTPHYTDRISCDDWLSKAKPNTFGKFLSDPAFKADFKKVEESTEDKDFQYTSYKPLKPISIFGQTITELNYYIENQNPRISATLKGNLAQAMTTSSINLQIDDWQPQNFEMENEDGGTTLGVTYYAVSFNQNQQAGYDASFVTYDKTFMFECSPIVAND